MANNFLVYEKFQLARVRFVPGTCVQFQALCHYTKLIHSFFIPRITCNLILRRWEHSYWSYPHCITYYTENKIFPPWNISEHISSIPIGWVDNSVDVIVAETFIFTLSQFLHLTFKQNIFPHNLSSKMCYPRWHGRNKKVYSTIFRSAVFMDSCDFHINNCNRLYSFQSPSADSWVIQNFNQKSCPSWYSYCLLEMTIYTKLRLTWYSRIRVSRTRVTRIFA